MVYIPEVKPVMEKPPSVSMTSRYWKLPVNAEELIAAIRVAAGGDLSLEVKAPPTVTIELLRQEKTGSMFVHLINCDAIQHPVVNSVAVSAQIPDGKRVARISILSPDEDKSLTIAPGPKGQRMEFAVARLATYSLGVINWG